MQDRGYKIFNSNLPKKLLVLFCIFILGFSFVFAQEPKEEPKQKPAEEPKQELKQELKVPPKEELKIPPKEEPKPQPKEELKAPPEEEPKEPVVVIKPDFEFNLDINSKVIPMPKIFTPSIDLSGRGVQRDKTWPYHISAKQLLEKWQKEPGFNKGIFRLHWNFWETNQGKKIDKSLQKQIIANYETIIKNISDAGGIVILSLYGTPPGHGRALDKISPPSNLKRWKILIKNTVRYLSCEKKYNIWYEAWDAPDKDNFFLGLKKDYLNLYRFTALAIKELEREHRMHIPIGGPAVSWWFQNFDGNNILTAEKSLIYELIKYCSHYRLPLDFISWHTYTTDPLAEKETTTYKKEPSQLIRDWLTFFRFDKNTPLVIDEWNYDSGANLLEERSNKSYICASFIPSRLKSMFEAGIDYQCFFSLEDFGSEKQEIINNRGIFFYNAESSTYSGKAKSIYNVFMMLSLLGDNLYRKSNIDSEFVNILATKGKDYIAILVWNYIDPYIGWSFLSRNVALLTEKGRTSLLSMMKEDKLNKLFNGEFSINDASVPDKLKSLLKNASSLKARSLELLNKPLNLKITLSNIRGDYLYQKYTVDDSCAYDCPFLPVEEKELTNIDTTYQQTLRLNPYSVNLIILKHKVVATEPSE